MPTYDYVCEACDHQFEAFQSMSAPVKRKCPQCGRQRLRRLIGPGAAIVFKGSGFYATDYRSESYKKAASADKSNAPAASGAGSDSGAAAGNGKGKAKDAAKDAPAAKTKDH
ncbi:MAG: zinc ribbon domain-containing protein [Thermoguttaceae bacterium]|jgi:putative FmdB family regulatory protein